MLFGLEPGLAARHGERVESGGDDEEGDGGNGVAADVAGDDEGGGGNDEAQKGVELPDGDGALDPAAPPHHVRVPAWVERRGRLCPNLHCHPSISPTGINRGPIN